ncbi:MAG TPA: TIM-barrel domain-containing protein [Prolixibacteraceae bacterium]|jgi:alpha-glucosidase (family GH31 glycosyl hydrolase)
MTNPLNLFVKYFLFSLSIFFFFFQNSYGQPSMNGTVVSIKNNKYVSIQACTNQIFRIRVSSNTNFPETLMERYGILKTDWTSVNISLRTENKNRIFQTEKYQLSVNEETGNISVADLNGKSIINTIRLSQDQYEPFTTELGQSLEQYFGKEKQEGGIIGDTNHTVLAADSIKTKSSYIASTLEISLTSDERFYGGGNTSRKTIQHRGEALRMWATYQKTEIPMPFLASSNGWGIFYNTTSLHYFDIGRFQQDKLFVYNTAGDMDFYLLLGNNIDESINLYTEITGKPYLLPKWAYGFAFGSNTMENQIDVMNDAVRFRDEKIPCDIYWLEPQWMSQYYDFSTKQNWDLTKFMAEPFWELDKYPKYEDKTLFIAKLHNLGFKLALWLGIDHDLSIAEEDHIAEKSGKPLSGQEHWFTHLTNFMDQGVDGFKLDPGRTLDEHPGMKYYNGYSDNEMHNLNQVLLSKQMNETFRGHKGIRSFHHYCGGYAGSQHWGAATSGDNGGGKDALFDQLNLGLSGFINTSCDVEDSKASLHLGFFLPWVQVNSWCGLLQPWYLKPIQKEAFLYYAQLRYSLSPYIYSAALQGSQTSIPILRAMPLEFPDDRHVDNMIYQYMFGENLLVGVFSDSIYLPKGNWKDYWSGEKYSGGQTIHCKIPDNRGGLLFIKAGAIIPYQKPMQYMDEYAVDTLIVKVFPDKQSSYTLLEDDGRTFDYEKGSIARTQFECHATDKQTEFVIYPVVGTYNGIYTSRTYQLEIDFPRKPKNVWVNGNKSKSWIFDHSGKVLLIMNKKSTTEKQVITIL